MFPGKFKYKLWRQESEERGWWLDSNDSVASEDARKQSTMISRQESEEKSWWLESNDSAPSDETKKQSSSTTSRHDSGDRGRWLDGNDSIASEESKKSSHKKSPPVWRQDSGERSRLLDANDSSPLEESKKQSSSSSRRESSRSSIRSNDRRNRIRHQQSGERAWWMCDNPDNVPDGVEVIPVAAAPVQNANYNDDYNDEVDDCQTYDRPLNKLKHVASGEKAWWMDSSSNVPDGVVAIPVESSNSTSDSSESFEKIDIGVNPELEIYAKRSLSRFPIEFPPPPPDEPLGDRASPEGVK